LGDLYDAIFYVNHIVILAITILVGFAIIPASSQPITYDLGFDKGDKTNAWNWGCSESQPPQQLPSTNRGAPIIQPQPGMSIDPNSIDRLSVVENPVREGAKALKATIFSGDLVNNGARAEVVFCNNLGPGNISDHLFKDGDEV
jgi:hypothetical protein